jgi:hypothetical protein
LLDALYDQTVELLRVVVGRVETIDHSEVRLAAPGVEIMLPTGQSGRLSSTAPSDSPSTVTGTKC